MKPRENATSVEEYTYRVVMFAYSGDIKSALAEIGQMQDSNIVPTEHQYKALKCACKLNDRLDLLPLIVKTVMTRRSRKPQSAQCAYHTYMPWCALCTSSALVRTKQCQRGSAQAP
jgi:hypothetical protein